MIPEIFDQNTTEFRKSDTSEVTEVVLSKSDFDSMMEVIDNPPSLPEQLVMLAAWYNNMSK